MNTNATTGSMSCADVIQHINDLLDHLGIDPMDLHGTEQPPLPTISRRKRAAPELTAERLRELLHYDPDTGVFTWRVRTNSRAAAGAVAGAMTGRGYLRIGINRKEYMSHRLAWLYVHGSWPEGDIDHRDGNPLNNRIGNLRDVTNVVNLQNQRRARAGNKCGLLGVSPSQGKWMAQIRAEGRNRYLGRFDTPALAHAAYLRAKRELHPGCTL